MQTPTGMKKTLGNKGQLIPQKAKFQKQNGNLPGGAGLQNSLRQGPGKQGRESLRIQRKRTKKEKLYGKHRG